ncbi:MAG: MATE family efflux transporter [Clostridia bacterium]|nr:MATE family efflux transporter [Clostridia bacterium]
MAKKNIDMTQGKLGKAMIAFSIPLILSGLLQQMYSWADAFIVGNIEGELALAAVGASGVISRMVTMVLTGFAAGLSVLAAQVFGRGEKGKLSAMLSTFAPIFGGIAAAAAVVMAVFARPLLAAYDTPANVFEMSVDYLRWYMLGTPFMAVYNVYSSVLRGMGDSKAPFRSIMVSSGANIALDLLFVGAFGWGAAGAALATALSQAAMTIFIVWYTVARYEELRFKLRGMGLDRAMLKEGFSFGLPMALQQSVNSIGQIALQGFQNSFGSATVAAISTAYRVDSLMLLPVMNLGHGVATAVGQNVGTGNKERVRQSMRIGLGIISATCIVLTLVVVAWGGKIVALFGVSEEAVEIGTRFFRCLAPFYITFGLSTTIQGYIKGMGDMKFFSIANIVLLGIRVAASYIMKPYFGNMSIAWAEVLVWVIQPIVWIIRARQLEKKHNV